MEVLDTLQRAVKAAASVVSWGAGLQENTRRNFVTDIQVICTNSESAYDAVLARLIPVKNAYNNPVELARELRAFAADQDTRRKFKPEYLCSQVDLLLTNLKSNLNPLRYSINVRRIDELQRALTQFGNVDGAIFESFDDFTRDLDRIATEIDNPASDARERSNYAQQVIDEFDAELRSYRINMREAKAQVMAAV